MLCDGITTTDGAACAREWGEGAVKEAATLGRSSAYAPLENSSQSSYWGSWWKGAPYYDLHHIEYISITHSYVFASIIVETTTVDWSTYYSVSIYGVDFCILCSSVLLWDGDVCR